MPELAATEVDSHAAAPASDDSGYGASLRVFMHAAIRLPQLKLGFSAVWPGAVDLMIPGALPEAPATGVSAIQADAVPAQDEKVWTATLSLLVLLSLPTSGKHAEVFDQLQLRIALAESLAAAGFDHDSSWRVAARVRLLLLQADRPDFTISSEAFWADPDVRWLGGVNESAGVAYFNKEQFEELLCWLQIPRLLKIASTIPFDQAELRKVETEVAGASDRARQAGYQLSKYLKAHSSTEIEDGDGESLDTADPLVASTTLQSSDVETQPLTKA